MTMHVFSLWKELGLIIALLLGSSVLSAQGVPPPASASAASTESAHPDTDYMTPVKTEPERVSATGFVVPDLPDEWNKKTAYDGKSFATRLSVAAIVDYTAFTQDAASVDQVSNQKNQWDVRTFRIINSGQVKIWHPIRYLVSLEVKGQDHVQTGSSKLGFTDWDFGTSLGRFGTIKYGKLKEPFAYEMVGDAANLQQQERILSPFFASRGVGIRMGNSIAHDRMTWSVGWFNDWYIENASFKQSGNDFAARLTGLPSWSDDGANFIELGISTRSIDADQGKLRFRGRPESNTASYYVDSGDMPANRATELGFEALAGHGPFLVSSEYVKSWIDSPQEGDPHFWGGYVTVSYVLSCEHRPYDRKAGYARRVLPNGRWGAWEVFGRYSHVDIEDQLISGGVMDKGAFGINWWATRRWKFGFDYGLTGLDKGGMQGVTNAFHPRIQWVY